MDNRNIAARIAGCGCVPFLRPKSPTEDAQFSLWVGNHQPTKWGGIKPEVTGVVYSGMDGNNLVLTVFIRRGTFPVYIPVGTREFRLMGKEVMVLEEPNHQNFQFILKGG